MRVYGTKRIYNSVIVADDPLAALIGTGHKEIVMYEVDASRFHSAETLTLPAPLKWKKYGVMRHEEVSKIRAIDIKQNVISFFEAQTPPVNKRSLFFHFLGNLKNSSLPEHMNTLLLMDVIKKADKTSKNAYDNLSSYLLTLFAELPDMEL